MQTLFNRITDPLEQAMNRDNHYTRISCNRSDLFDVCKQGFIVHRIGDLLCEGWVLTERLAQIDVPYRKV